MIVIIWALHFSTLKPKTNLVDHGRKYRVKLT